MGVTYLFPVTEYDQCSQAALFYLERLHREGDTLIFIHIVEPNFRGPKVSVSSEPSSSIVGEMTPTMRDAMAAGKLLIQRHLLWSREQGVNSRSFIYIDSKPAVAILKAARNLKVDHILMASRRLNALGRTITGNMSTHIVHHSTVPVTIVPITPPENSTGLIRRLSLN